MPFDRQAAKAAGYSEEEIDSYLQNQAGSPPPPSPSVSAEVGEPPAPTTTVTPAGEGNYMPTLATAGLAAAGAALPAAIGYGAAKFGGRALDAMKGLASGGAKVPVTAPVNPTAVNVGLAAAPGMPAPQAAAAQEAQQIQKANSIVRQLALDKVLKSAGMPAAVAASGAAATGLAANQMRAMTPEQRKGFYENPMLGAMGGDAGLAAAIMNQGR